jgi:hypothetical protein
MEVLESVSRTRVVGDEYVKVSNKYDSESRLFWLFSTRRVRSAESIHM